MTTKYINGSGLSKLLQLISNSVGQALSSISSRLSNLHSTYANLINVKYNELYDMTRGHNLIPGQYYRITDYVTTTSQEDTMSNGQIRPIIVLATDYNTLSEEAMTDDGCKVWYCIDNDTNRFAWAGATKPVLSVNCRYNGGLTTFKRDESLIIEESDITYYGYIYNGGSDNSIFNENSVLWYTEEFPEFTDDYISHTFYQISDGEMVPINIDSNFYEVEEKIGKGVIYRMIDKNGNDLPYDFKSIMFKNPNDETDENYYYTFYYRTGDMIFDAIDVIYTKDKCYNNVIKCRKEGSVTFIPINIFQFWLGSECYNNTFGNNCYNNIFGINFCNNILGNSCYNNTFGNSCYNNTFGNSCYNNTLNSCYNNTFGNSCYNNTLNSCYNNTFGNSCYNNTFVTNCNDNTFGDGCYNNTFGDNCYDNTLGNNCDSNTLGDNCYDNTLGNNCDSNTLGSGFNSNTFGYGCYNNIFGTGCSSNTFGNNCDNNTFGSNCYNNTFGSDCHDNSFIYINNSGSTQTGILNGIVNCYFSNEYQYNELKHLKTSNTNSSAYLKNVYFCKGLKGSKSGSKITYNTITIEGELPGNAETKVAKNSKGELKIYCEADLIA